MRQTFFARALALLLGTFVVVLTVGFGDASAGNRLDPNDHWNDGGSGDAWVTLVDKTGPNWPVGAAAIEWDNAGRIDVIWQIDDCGGFGHCVSVDKWTPGVGCRTPNSSFVSLSHSGGHLDDDSFILLNQACVTSGNFNNHDRRVITCQEEGHILGLDHDFPAGHHNTCMAATSDDFDHATAFPRQHDFVMLDDVIYDHND